MITSCILIPIAAIFGAHSWSTLATVSADTGLVAFTAVQNTHLNLTHNDTVPFTKIVTNQQADISSGIFTCTSSGIYKFQVYALTRSDESLFLELYHNEQLVASLWARTKSDYADGGNAAILNLNAGDTVQVKSRAGYQVSTFGTSNEIYTTFTGIQLGGSAATSESTVTAFSVALTSHQDVIGGAPVVYNTVLLDTDSAYDVSSGTFTAPSAGIYVLHFFSLARYDETLWQELFHNGDYVCSLYGKTTQEYADAGNTAIIHLKAGDQVQVRAHSSQQNSIYGAGDQIYSTFSGYQLIPEWKIDSTEGAPSVYFSAGLSHSATYQDGQKVVFDRIFSDHGTINHYNHLNGEFTAPYSGTYEFNFHALGQNKQKVFLDLYHNYKYIDSLYTHVPDGYGAAGNAAVIEMDAGDVVYIRAHGTNALYGTGSQVYCTFSGTLLSQRGGDTSIVGK